MVHIQESFPQVSERRACRVLGQPRTTQRRVWVVPDDEEPLVKRMIELATQYGRYGYRLVTGMLRNEGWQVNQTDRTALEIGGVESAEKAAETEAVVAE